MDQIDTVLAQAKEAGVEWIYFEGGEPFLYYAELVRGVRRAAEMDFAVGVVSNAYWAVSVYDAVEWLQPFVGRLQDLTVSSDLFHCEKYLGEEPQNALAAAKWLNIPTGMISIAQPGECATESRGQISDASALMFRGRAAQVLAAEHPDQPWESLTSCPHEDLRDPGRVHLDPLGYIHVCQGVTIGNVFQQPLKDICDAYDPESHPICGPLLDGGPAALVTEYGLAHREAYADACHLCYEARSAMRPRFPQILVPDQMYGVVE
jgi:MoaA/NifB/PqqE/SkfB family radical SAM enzyme